jgi:hypothetical protein
MHHTLLSYAQTPINNLKFEIFKMPTLAKLAHSDGIKVQSLKQIPMIS